MTPEQKPWLYMKRASQWDPSKPLKREDLKKEEAVSDSSPKRRKGQKWETRWD